MSPGLRTPMTTLPSPLTSGSFRAAPPAPLALSVVGAVAALPAQPDSARAPTRARPDAARRLRSVRAVVMSVVSVRWVAPPCLGGGGSGDVVAGRAGRPARLGFVWESRFWWKGDSHPRR